MVPGTADKRGLRRKSGKKSSEICLAGFREPPSFLSSELPSPLNSPPSRNRFIAPDPCSSQISTKSFHPTDLALLSSPRPFSGILSVPSRGPCLLFGTPCSSSTFVRPTSEHIRLPVARFPPPSTLIVVVTSQVHVRHEYYATKTE